MQENTAKGKSFFKVYWIQAPTALSKQGLFFRRLIPPPLRGPVQFELKNFSTDDVAQLVLSNWLLVARENSESCSNQRETTL